MKARSVSESIKRLLDNDRPWDTLIAAAVVLAIFLLDRLLLPNLPNLLTPR